jgi:hypothetical protein
MSRVLKAPYISIVIIVTYFLATIVASTSCIKVATRSITKCFRRAPLYYRERIPLVKVV